MVNACLFSGGKDSTLALHRAIESGIKIDLLITMAPKSEESLMYHFPNIDSTTLQAEALGIRQEIVDLEEGIDNELNALEAAIKQNGVKTLVTGAVASNYQRSRIDAIAKKYGVNHVAPLWGIDPVSELNELAEKFNVIIVQVSAEGLKPNMLGSRIDAQMIEKLKEINRRHRINMLFEGGEAETFVLDAPLFRKKIEIRDYELIEGNSLSRYVIKKAVLVDKDK